jgi:quinol monooxygenase YgiN
MTYIRVSTMTPLAGRDEEATQVNQELVDFYSMQEGCVSNYFVKAADKSGEQGRISVWSSERAANEAATQERSLQLRSRLHLLVRRGHQDRSFTVAGATKDAAVGSAV